MKPGIILKIYGEFCLYFLLIADIFLSIMSWRLNFRLIVEILASTENTLLPIFNFFFFLFPVIFSLLVNHIAIVYVKRTKFSPRKLKKCNNNNDYYNVCIYYRFESFIFIRITNDKFYHKQIYFNWCIFASSYICNTHCGLFLAWIIPRGLLDLLSTYIL